jgi:hypothetical protein
LARHRHVVVWPGRAGQGKGAAGQGNLTGGLSKRLAQRPFGANMAWFDPSMARLGMARMGGSWPGKVAPCRRHSARGLSRKSPKARKGQPGTARQGRVRHWSGWACCDRVRLGGFW